MRLWLLTAALSLLACDRRPPAQPPTPTPTPVTRTKAPDLEVTILSTMLADRGIGEWGFAAFVEVDGRRILFDTGLRPETVLRNAKTVGVDLSTVDEVVLSHHHDDHVGGLLPLRGAFPDAMATVHVARGMFVPRRFAGRERQVNDMLAIRTAFEATGGRFVVHDSPAELAPGVWVTGPVPRPNAERNWSGARQIEGTDGWVDDRIAESQSLVIVTDRGLVVISGCGHAGIVNTLQYATTAIAARPVHAAIGGFHLLEATDTHLQWTATRLADAGVEYFFGGHCTGLEPVYRFRELMGLDRAHSTVAAVGASFALGEGIRPRALAR